MAWLFYEEEAQQEQHQDYAAGDLAAEAAFAQYHGHDQSRDESSDQLVKVQHHWNQRPICAEKISINTAAATVNSAGTMHRRSTL